MMAALMVGFFFGATFYRIFVAPYMFKQAYKLGRTSAAVDVRGWLDAMEPEFMHKVEANMHAYNLQKMADEAAAKAPK